MLDKKRASLLSTHRTNFGKQVDAYYRDIQDVLSVLDHLSYVCSSIMAVEKSSIKGRPETVFILFSDVPDLVKGNLMIEGHNSLFQLKQIERSIDDIVNRMRAIVTDALTLVENEDCPTTSALEDLTVGTQLEQILELQDVYGLMNNECCQFKNILNRYIFEDKRKDYFQPGITASPTTGLAKALNHSAPNTFRSDWFQLADITTAIEEWKALRNSMSDKVAIFRLGMQTKAAAIS